MDSSTLVELTRGIRGILLKHDKDGTTQLAVDIDNYITNFGYNQLAKLEKELSK